jgi:hypothetical protein
MLRRSFQGFPLRGCRTLGFCAVGNAQYLAAMLGNDISINSSGQCCVHASCFPRTFSLYDVQLRPNYVYFQSCKVQLSWSTRPPSSHATPFSHHNIPFVFLDHLRPSLIQSRPLTRAVLAQSTNDKRRCDADMICFRNTKTGS